MARSNFTYTRKHLTLEYDRRIGELLRAKRESRDMTQIALSARLDCTQPMISKIETGDYSIKLADVPQFARALDLDPDELLAELWSVVMAFDPDQE